MNRFISHTIILVSSLILSFETAHAEILLTGESESMPFQVEKVVKLSGIPWGITSVDNENLLVSERSGKLYKVNRFSGSMIEIPITQNFFVRSQGGLLDIAATKNTQATEWLYFSYSKPVNNGATTALARAKLVGNSIQNWQEIFVTKSEPSNGRHFGSRIAFDNQGHVFLSIGDHGSRPNGQNLRSHAGTIVRLDLDGKTPSDNPFIGESRAQEEIWSYGHRNPQGMYFDHKTKTLWAIEHGPRGGDEINLIQKGANYGWATISYGKEYWGPLQVGEGSHKEGMKQPIKQYTPSIAPSGLLVYQGQAFPNWKGSLFTGALKLQHLNRVMLNGSRDAAIKEERLLENLNRRIRDVHESPEGWIYIATDHGEILSIKPATKKKK